MQRLNYAWRLGCTGIAFAFIFLGAVTIAAVAGPISRALGGDSPKRIRSLIRHAFRVYIGMLKSLRLVSLEVVGGEKLATPKGRMVIANHPSILDVVILMALTPHTQCIVKHQLWNHRFLGGLMRSAGYIRNDLEPEILIEQCKYAIERGQSLIIFPEGTRTVPGVAPSLQRGFANIALFSAALILPVTIRCDPPTLLKGEPWWRIAGRKPHFKITVDEYLDPALYLDYEEGKRSVSARKLVTFIEKYYTEKTRDG